MKIYLVRHGKTENNEKDVFNDENDIGLNTEGKKQAEKLAERLTAEPLEVIISGMKKRVIHTAEIIAKRHPKIKQIETTEDIRQRDVGIFAGKPIDDLAKKAEERGVPSYLYRPENGESFEDMYVRAKKVYDRIISEHKGRNVLVVGHKGFNKAFLGAAMQLGIPQAYELKQDNCCLNILEIDKFRVARPLVINDTHHLD